MTITSMTFSGRNDDQFIYTAKMGIEPMDYIRMPWLSNTGMIYIDLYFTTTVRSMNLTDIKTTACDLTQFYKIKMGDYLLEKLEHIFLRYTIHDIESGNIPLFKEELSENTGILS